MAALPSSARAPKPPSTEAMPPPGADPLVGAALRSIDAILASSPYREAEALQRYYDGSQYENRPYTWDGSLRFESGVAGVRVPSMTNGPIPLSDRVPVAKYGISKTITRRLTNMLFGKGKFPKIRVDDDPTSEDFVEGVRVATDLEEKMKHARNTGGSTRSAYVSWGWTAGEPLVEVHNPRSILVLKWADAAEGVPAHVLKFWTGEELSADRAGHLVSKTVWYAREWRAPDRVTGVAGQEVVYRYDAGTVIESGALVGAKWEQKGEALEIDECPVVWIANEADLDSPLKAHADYEGSEGLIDGLNITLNSSLNGIAINADPTLSIDLPMGDPRIGQDVTTGNGKTIFAPASFVEVSGSSVAAGLGAVDRTRALVFEAADVVMLDPERLAGAQSGEALRRLFVAMTQQCDSLRVPWGKGLVRIVRGLLRQAQRLEAMPPREVPLMDDATEAPVLGPGGEPVLVLVSGVTFRIPPRVTKAGASTPDGKQEQVQKLAERRPGAGSLVRLEWPEYFPDSPIDQVAKVNVAVTGNGNMPVMSPKTAIKMAATVTGVEDPDQELKDIIEGMRELSDAKAGSLGVMPPNGAAPPGEDDEPPKAKAKPKAHAEPDDDEENGKT